MSSSFSFHFLLSLTFRSLFIALFCFILIHAFSPLFHTSLIFFSFLVCFFFPPFNYLNYFLLPFLHLYSFFVMSSSLSLFSGILSLVFKFHSFISSFSCIIPSFHSSFFLISSSFSSIHCVLPFFFTVFFIYLSSFFIYDLTLSVCFHSLFLYLFFLSFRSFFVCISVV